MYSSTLRLSSVLAPPIKAAVTSGLCSISLSSQLFITCMVCCFTVFACGLFLS